MDCRQANDPHDHGHDHGHSHSHDGGDGHDHVAPLGENEPQFFLHPHIDHDKVITLNEQTDGSGRDVLRKWADRLLTEPLLESDTDEELLITIPFTGVVQLRSILIRSPADERAPDTIKLFKNRTDIDFNLAQDLSAVQKLEHPENIGIGSTEENGIVEYALNRPLFANVTSLTIFIASNHGAETSAVSFIGLRGTWQKLSKAPVVALYEAAANPADHKTLVPDSIQKSV